MTPSSVGDAACTQVGHTTGRGGQALRPPLLKPHPSRAEGEADLGGRHMTCRPLLQRAAPGLQTSASLRQHNRIPGDLPLSGSRAGPGRRLSETHSDFNRHAESLVSMGHRVAFPCTDTVCDHQSGVPGSP